MKRYGMVIRVRADKIEEYRCLHRAVWPAVQAQIRRSGIRNYTIYLREPECLLFSHFDYHGNDFSADLAAMAADPETQRWWAVCAPCQQPLESSSPGEHWAEMIEVFHQD